MAQRDGRSSKPDEPQKPGKASWKNANRAPEKRKYSWTTGANNPEQDRVEDGNRKHRVRAMSWTLLALCLFGALAYYLLFWPRRTPVVVMAATDYTWPVPPNAWALEDVEGFTPLVGDTIDLLNLTESWNSRESHLDKLSVQLEELGRDQARAPVIIFYISMHGVVDGNGTPCLLPPGASPQNSAAWIKVADLLERVKTRLPTEPAKLVIFDCNRLDVNWSLGLLYNGFADNLARVVEAAKVPNLVVLNSTQPGQVNWASEKLQGSVFGHFTAAGLAGAADLAVEGGNDDGRVTLRELDHYLQHQVRNWVSKNRDDDQRPLLILPPNTPPEYDLSLSWAVGRGIFGNRLERLEALVKNPVTPWSAPVSDSDLGDLWEKRDQLRRRVEPAQFDPLPFQELEHKLLWLEQLVAAGKGYKNQAERLKSELEGMVQSAKFLELDRELRAHSLPLAERLGWMQQSTTAEGGSTTSPALALASYPIRARSAWKNVREYFSAGDTRKNHLTEAFDLVGQPEPAFAPGFVEMHYLRMLDQFLPPNVWQAGGGRYLSLALDGRDLAERAAAPRDPRALYWIRPQVNGGDEVRRRAEDNLFIGEPRQLEEAAGIWDGSAKDQFNQAVDIGKQISEAFEVRDRAWDELPYLAEYLLEPLPPQIQAREEQDKLVRPQLAELIEKTHILANLLEADPTRDKPDLSKVTEQAAAVRELHDALRNRYDNHCVQLLTAASRDQFALRELERVLSVPLVSARQRGELRLLYGKIISQGRDSDSPTPGGLQGVKLATDAPVNRLLPWVAQSLPRHICLRILEPAAPTAVAAGPAEDAEPPKASDQVLALAQQGEEVRLFLSKLQEQIEVLLHDARQALKDGARSDFDVRQVASRADQLLRRAVALKAGLPGRSPVAELRRIDLHNLLVWHAQRTLDDFWGPSEQPFFELAADQYLRLAKSLCQTDTGTRSRQAEPVFTLLETRSHIAREGLSLEAYSPPSVTDEAQERIDMNSQVSIASWIPAGRAALFVRDTNHPALPLIDKRSQTGNRLEVDLNPQPGQDTTAIPVAAQAKKESLSDAGPRFNTDLVFRGHSRTAPFSIHWALAGIEMAFAPAELIPPRVTVYGQTKRRGSVVFILDCSYSMRQRDVPVEGGSLETRMNVARAALRGILQEMGRDGSYDVGVIIYGHRSRYKPDGSGTVLRPDWPRPFDKGLLPFQDVEVVQTLGEFGRSEFEEVGQLVDQTQEWGLTPLYPAIREAVRNFAGFRSETQSTIVVITDGIDEQYISPTLPNARNYRKVTRDEVVQECRQQNVAVQILGFSVDKKDEAQANLDFKEIANQTGGVFYSANNEQVLVEALRKTLDQSKFEVFNPENRLVDSQRLGNTLELKTFRGRGEYRVDLPVGRETLPASAKLDLIGGEAIELFLSKDRRKLEPRRYEGGSPVFSPPIVDPLSPQDQYLVGAHRPEWGGNDLRFPISLQRKEANLFAKNPAEVWIDIQPVRLPGTEPKPGYVIYDLTLQPERPVPIASAWCPSWPEEVRQADVRMWCKFLTTPPDRSFKVSERLNKSTTDQGLNLTYRVELKRPTRPDEPLRVVVTFGPDFQNHDIYSIKVNMSPPPVQIRRRFEEKDGFAVHTFAYKNLEERDVLDYQIEFTKRESMQNEQSVDMGAPVRVKIEPKIRTVP